MELKDKRVLGVYCAGGFGGVIKNLAEATDRWELIQYIDDNIDIVDEKNIMSFKYFCQKYDNEEAEIIISAGEPKVRTLIYKCVKNAGYTLPNIFSRQTDILRMPELGEGNVFLAYTSIAPNDVRIGNNNVFMTFVRLGHGTVIGNNCVVSTHATLAGNVTLGNGSFIGIGSNVREQIQIGSNSVVGMGAVVCENVADSIVVAGNPARFIKQNTTYIFKNAKNDICK